MLGTYAAQGSDQSLATSASGRSSADSNGQDARVSTAGAGAGSAGAAARGPPAAPRTGTLLRDRLTNSSSSSSPGAAATATPARSLRGRTDLAGASLRKALGRAHVGGDRGGQKGRAVDEESRGGTAVETILTADDDTASHVNSEFGMSSQAGGSGNVRSRGARSGTDVAKRGTVTPPGSSARHDRNRGSESPAIRALRREGSRRSRAPSGLGSPPKVSQWESIVGLDDAAGSASLAGVWESRTMLRFRPAYEEDYQLHLRERLRRQRLSSAAWLTCIILLAAPIGIVQFYADSHISLWLTASITWTVPMMLVFVVTRCAAAAPGDEDERPSVAHQPSWARKLRRTSSRRRSSATSAATKGTSMGDGRTATGTGFDNAEGTPGDTTQRAKTRRQDDAESRRSTFSRGVHADSGAAGGGYNRDSSSVRMRCSWCDCSGPGAISCCLPLIQRNARVAAFARWCARHENLLLAVLTSIEISSLSTLPGAHCTMVEEILVGPCAALLQGRIDWQSIAMVGIGTYALVFNMRVTWTLSIAFSVVLVTVHLAFLGPAAAPENFPVWIAALAAFTVPACVASYNLELSERNAYTLRQLVDRHFNLVIQLRDTRARERRHRTAAEAAQEAVRRVLAFSLHELRNPLTALCAVTDGWVSLDPAVGGDEAVSLAPPMTLSPPLEHVASTSSSVGGGGAGAGGGGGAAGGGRISKLIAADDLQAGGDRRGSDESGEGRSHASSMESAPDTISHGDASAGGSDDRSDGRAVSAPRPVPKSTAVAQTLLIRHEPASPRLRSAPGRPGSPTLHHMSPLRPPSATGALAPMDITSTSPSAVDATLMSSPMAKELMMSPEGNLQSRLVTVDLEELRIVTSCVAAIRVMADDVLDHQQLLDGSLDVVRSLADVDRLMSDATRVYRVTAQVPVSVEVVVQRSATTSASVRPGAGFTRPGASLSSSSDPLIRDAALKEAGAFELSRAGDDDSDGEEGATPNVKSAGAPAGVAVMVAAAARPDDVAVDVESGEAPPPSPTKPRPPALTIPAGDNFAGAEAVSDAEPQGGYGYDHGHGAADLEAVAHGTVAFIDPHRVVQCLANGLSNACRLTREGGIDVRAVLRPMRDWPEVDPSEAKGNHAALYFGDPDDVPLLEPESPVVAGGGGHRGARVSESKPSGTPSGGAPAPWNEGGGGAVEGATSGGGGGAARRRTELFVEVVDTGPGISDAAVEGVFTDTRLEEELHHNARGTGLGLPFSAMVCGLMGGHIGLHSTADGRTRFWFVVPADEPPQGSAGDGGDGGGGGGGADSSGESGAEGAAAGSGGGAAAAASGHGGTHLQRHITDGSMASMSSASGSAMRRAPVLYMAQHGDRTPGFTGPVSPRSAALNRRAPRRSPTAAGAAGAPKSRAAAAAAQAQELRRIYGSLKGLHVLVVDDEVLNRKIAARFLRTLGCTTELLEDAVSVPELLRTRRSAAAAAAAGEPGAIAVRSPLPTSPRSGATGAPAVAGLSPTGKEFDAIFMDIMLIHSNGADVTRHIRMAGFPDLPVFAMTANLSNTDLHRYVQCGMTAVVPKPFTAAMMADVLERFVVKGGPAMTTPAAPMSSPSSSGPMSPRTASAEAAAAGRR